MRPKVIYILGFGHSGSTLLDIMLSNHPNVVGVGEINKLHRYGWIANEDRRCACGLPHYKCLFWRTVRQHWVDIVGKEDIEGYIRLQNQYERARPLYRLIEGLWGRLRQSEHFCMYLDQTTALYRAIQNVSEKSIIVDSSKKILRPYALLKSQKIDLYLVHLIRDGRGVVWSHMKPKEREKNPAAGRPKDYYPRHTRQITIRWLVTNLIADWMINQAGKRHGITVLYEQLIQDPEGQLNRIGALVGENYSEIGRRLNAGQHMHIGHMAAGNSIRMAKLITLKSDVEWTDKLPDDAKTSFWRIAGWLDRRYGYKR